MRERLRAWALLWNGLMGPDRFGIPLTAAVIVKGVLFLGLLARFGAPAFPGYWGGFTFDSSSYMDPAEHWLAGQGYSPDYRMPGLAAPYVVLRMVLDQGLAMNVILIAQYLLGALSVVMLARIAYRATASMAVYHAVFIIYAVSTFVSLYDVLFLTESSATALPIIAFYMVLPVNGERRPFRKLIAGACMAWAIFLRPVWAPMLLPLALVPLMQGAWRSGLRAAMMVLLPFILVDGIWCARNWSIHGRLLPLSTSVLMPDYDGSPNHDVARMVQAFGGSFLWWDERSEIRALGVRDLGDDRHLTREQVAERIPDHALTAVFTRDSLLRFAAVVEEERLSISTPVDHERLRKLIRTTADGYVASYASERPVDHLLWSRFRLLGAFLLHDGTYMEMPAPRGPAERAARWFYSALYVCVMLGGCLGGLLVLATRRRWPLWSMVVPAILGYGVLVHPFVLRLTEYRYLVPFYPFALVCLAMAVWQAAGRGHSSTSSA